MESILNKAKVRYLGMTRGSNITKGNLNDTVAVTKTVNNVSYVPGSVVTYFVSIINSGATDYTITEIVDNLGSYTFGVKDLVPLDYVPDSAVVLIEGVKNPDVEVTMENGIKISGFKVPAGKTAVVSYSVMVNEYAPLDTSETVHEIRNIAEVRGASNSVYVAESTIYPDTNANLVITKTIDKETVSPGDTVTYTFIVQNIGAGDADEAVNAAIIDTFDPRLTAISVKLDKNDFEEYNYSEETGEFITNDGAIKISGASFSRTETGSVIIDPQQVVMTVTGTIL